MKQLQWDHRTGRYVTGELPAPVFAGLSTSRSRSGLCVACGNKSANYGTLGTTKRLWCGQCSKTRGGTLQCK